MKQVSVRWFKWMGQVASALQEKKSLLGYEEEDEHMKRRIQKKHKVQNGKVKSLHRKVNEAQAPDLTVRFSEQVLHEFRNHVGKYKPETGGLLGSTNDDKVIDLCCFDKHSANTQASFYYDVEAMTKVFHDWKNSGYVTNGIFHSHPMCCIRPSYHDVASALMHLRFFKLDYFYLPIFQSERRGFYTMYFYVVRQHDEHLTVNLEYVVQATKKGYEYPAFAAWSQDYPIRDLDDYRNRVDQAEAAKKVNDPVAVKKEEQTVSVPACAAVEKPAGETSDTSVYFGKVKSLYPDNVLDKVICCVGVGGARSALENFARCGFRNFILMDADVVSPSNVAT